MLNKSLDLFLRKASCLLSQPTCALASLNIKKRGSSMVSLTWEELQNAKVAGCIKHDVQPLRSPCAQYLIHTRSNNLIKEVCLATSSESSNIRPASSSGAGRIKKECSGPQKVAVTLGNIFILS